MWQRHLSLLILCVTAPVAWADAAPKYPPAEEVRQAFRKLLDRPKVPHNVGSVKEASAGELETQTFSIASEKKADGQEERVPILLVRPTKRTGKLPAVIVLHGTGGSKEGQLGYMKELAKRGIIGVAIDARYHGARTGGAKGGYVNAITKAWQTPRGEKHEHPFYYDTCWDLWCVTDYLQTRDDIDGGKLGMIGFSMGGIQTWLAASADARIKAAVPAIGVQSFRWSLENDKWQGRANTIKGAHDAAAKDLGEEKVNQRVCRELWSKVIPGILDQFDCPSMLRLFAGRALLIVGGEKDGNCPYGGAKLAIAEAEAAFKAAGASDKLRVMIAEGVGHSVTAEQRQASLDWFVRWLR